ncbi:SsgA family sporulation/cell division regulator [Streptomyces sp. NRRL S-495]|uniref:SsgA family sporulation/cell division regulator n=1 Tax=Streptomyces sp. NRRL S-495 TaxID=1609133 RepID=UPI000695CAF0|nr:SsgA family sporulation/cell division regulator [Streptomyces sp. NRRL S-495]
MQLPLEKTISARLMTAEYEWHELTLCVRHSPDDALAVRMDLFAAEDDPPAATWVFGRDLLATGLILPTGEGDVRVRPHGEDETDVELVSGQSWCVVRMASAHVRDVVARTQSAEELWNDKARSELDRVLAEILSSGIRNADS